MNWFLTQFHFLTYSSKDKKCIFHPLPLRKKKWTIGHTHTHTHTEGACIHFPGLQSHAVRRRHGESSGGCQSGNRQWTSLSPLYNYSLSSSPTALSLSSLDHGTRVCSVLRTPVGARGPLCPPCVCESERVRDKDKERENERGRGKREREQVIERRPPWTGPSPPY